MAQKEIDYQGKRFAISYEMRNPSAKKTLLVLHGWGSNKEIMMQAFGALLPEYKHLYVDMPGFGKSPNDDTVLTTHDYARMMQAFLKETGASPQIVMGHSFGGKVATLLDPPCLVLLSSSGVLVPKPWNVRAKIALFKLLKPLGLSGLRRLFVSEDAKGMNEAMYATFKGVVNEEFEAAFGKTTGKALLFWGKSDTATPLWTAEKIASMMRDATLYPLTGDHYFFLHHAPFIAQTIEEQCKDEQA